MERPYILHMFTPGRQMSPFDINMAADAGYAEGRLAEGFFLVELPF